MAELAGIRRVLGCGLAAILAMAVPARAQDCAPADGAAVQRVEGIDTGMTLILAGGQKARLAGVLVPAGPPHEAAAAHRLRAMFQGRDAVISRAGHADRHGRLVAEVFTTAAAGVMAQEALAAAGLARVAPIKDNPACTAVLLAAENAARRANIGLWRDAAFAIRAADRPDELTGLIDTFQIVEGTIVSTGATRARAYLNFGKRWSEDFTGVIAAGDLDDFLDAGLVPSRLAGARVRVRGYLEEDGGPMMRLAVPAQIEVLEGR